MQTKRKVVSSKNSKSPRKRHLSNGSKIPDTAPGKTLIPIAWTLPVPKKSIRVIQLNRGWCRLPAVQINDWLLKELQAAAAREGKTLSYYLANAIRVGHIQLKFWARKRVNKFLARLQSPAPVGN